MTLAPNTIEGQLAELKAQYTHAAAICKNLRDMYEDKKRQHTELEIKLAARNVTITLLQAQIDNLSGDSGGCGAETCQCGKSGEGAI